jgi:hypothetical protein
MKSAKPKGLPFPLCRLSMEDAMKLLVIIGLVCTVGVFLMSFFISALMGGL